MQIFDIVEELEKERKKNKELEERINDVIEYLKYQLENLDFEKDTKAKMLGAMVIVLLEGSDNNE